jgi:hypothetical protein
MNRTGWYRLLVRHLVWDNKSSIGPSNEDVGCATRKMQTCVVAMVLVTVFGIVLRLVEMQTERYIKSVVH